MDRAGRERVETAAGAVLVLAWAFLGGGAGCFSLTPPPPAPGCLQNASLEVPTSSVRLYQYAVPNHTVDARGVDWVGTALDGVDLEGDGNGCFVGGRLEGSWPQTDSWSLYHDRKALSNGIEGRPLIIEKLHALNFGDGVSIEWATPCPNGSATWLVVRDSLLEDMHDDAIESDGLCSAEVTGSLIDRAYVAFAFRNRSNDPYRDGSLNAVVVRSNLVRMHAFPGTYLDQPGHRGIWKWADDGKGPTISVRSNRFLAFDAPIGGTLFPDVNRVSSCANNVFLFAGSEAEWTQALAGGCNSDDDLCDGERLLALSYCFSVVTKPDTQSEADFLAAHWDPHVAAWKSSHSADEE